MTQHVLVPGGGAGSRIDAEAIPLSQRSARWVIHPFATVEELADDAAKLGWCALRRSNAPFTTGAVYLVHRRRG